MSKYVTKDWHTDIRTMTLTLSMQAEVNGRVYRQEIRMGNSPMDYSSPAHYIERELRHGIMHAIEKDLFGEA